MKTYQSLTLLAAFAALLGFVGCSTPESRISEHPDVFARLTPEEQALVKEGKVGIGMDAAAVKLALGEPDRISYQTTAAGQSEIWHYEETIYYDGVYLYPGPYWHHRHPYWGGYWSRGGWGINAPAGIYDRFLVAFTDGKVTVIHQDTAP